MACILNVILTNLMIRLIPSKADTESYCSSVHHCDYFFAQTLESSGIGAVGIVATHLARAMVMLKPASLGMAASVATQTNVGEDALLGEVEQNQKRAAFNPVKQGGEIH